MEGKEVRFGVTTTALFDIASTSTSTGSADASNDSFTPIGGFGLLTGMMLGEVTPGGAGAGSTRSLTSPSSPCSSAGSWSGERRSTWARRSRRRR